MPDIESTKEFIDEDLFVAKKQLGLIESGSAYYFVHEDGSYGFIFIYQFEDDGLISIAKSRIMITQDGVEQYDEPITAEQIIGYMNGASMIREVIRERLPESSEMARVIYQCYNVNFNTNVLFDLEEDGHIRQEVTVKTDDDRFVFDLHIY